MSYYDAPDGYTERQARLIDSGAWDPEEQPWREYCEASDEDRSKMADL